MNTKNQEVIVYHAQYIKNLDNLSNLNPSSCILANAKKLTNVEIHSTELYNINVTNNTFLRTINLEGCTTLGTVTATGSSLDLSNCKYLRYCNVYNTALTEVQLNTSGGSLTEIYYPSTLQSMTLIKQTLLERIGLPYGTNGREVPTALYTVNIQECPNIKYLNTSDDPSINTTFASMYYCNNLTLRNSLDLEGLNFDGFHRLRNVTIENMYKLQSVGFNNLLPVGNTSTLKYVGFSNCPLLEEIELNCTSNDYEIAFDTNSILNFGGLSALKSISSNCVIKGLDTIVLPLKLESMYFTTEYGEGFSEIKNLWSSAVCNVNIAGSTVECIHVIEGYEGIDFAGMNLKNIDLGGLVNIKDAINFSLSPTTVNPNFNKNRDGVTYPYLQPSGTLDLSNYTESLAKFFDGVDLRKLQLICNNPLPQKDLSYCFYNSTFDKDSQISAVLNNIDTVNNMAYCFYKTSVKDVSILNSVNFLAGTSLAYCFAECKNISKLQNITLSGNIGNASYMFSGSGLTTIDNVSTSCNNIVGMFSHCDNLVTVNNFDANGTTSYESLFEGCGGMSVAPVTTIPATITNIKNMYKNCDGLVSIDGFVLHGNITEATGFVQGCNNLINANNVTISGAFYNDIFRGLTSLKYVNNLLINYVGRSMTFANMFDGCANLEQMSFHDDSYVKDVISMDYMFRGTSMTGVDFSNVNFEKIVSYKYMFADCLMEEFSFTVPRTITSIQGMLSNCRNLKSLRNFNISTNVTVTDWILDTPIENLIDCSFYNQNTSFKNNTTLKKIERFKYTGNNLSGYFDGCTNLKTAELTIDNAVKKADNLFANCPLLTSVEFNSESDLSGVTTISNMFNGDTSLSTIRNLKITNPSTLANNTTLSGCPVNNTDGFYINSNSAVEMFRMGTESKIIQFTDFELGTECNNLSDAFRDYPLLIKDIALPSHVINVSNTFNNCIAMENIVSNWTNSYDVNNDDDLDNDVVTEGCYEGSNNIKYIDGELYMNEYGELTAMDYIPQEWGGNASYEDNQTVFDVKITEDNLVYSLVGNVGDNVTNWGDGTEDMNISHEYSKPGTYTIITENILTFAQGTVVDSAISSPIVKFRALNKSQTNGSHLFDGWSNLLKVNKLTNTFNSYDYMFNNCAKLVDVDLSGCILSQTVTTMQNMCNGCSKFTKTPIKVIPDTCTNISYLFANSGITDISELTFGSGISLYGFWRLGTPITIANNLTIKCSQPLFQGCTTLVSIDNFTISSNISDVSSWFEDCTKLSEDFLIPSHVTNCTNTFKGCVKLTHAHSNWNNTYTNGITSIDCYAGCTAITHIDDENIVTYEGKEGLDEIPVAWGGYEFLKKNTSVFVLDIPSDNTEIYFSYIGRWNGKCLISWGDKTSSEDTLIHTYKKAGTYVVKIKTNGITFRPENNDKNFKYYITKILQLYTNYTNTTNGFRGCPKLEYVDVSDSKLGGGYCFIENPLLTTVRAYNCKIYGELGWNSTITTLEGYETWAPDSKSMNGAFKGLSKIESLDISSWNFTGTENISDLFNGCAKLKEIKGINNLDVSKVTNMSGMFNGCSSITSLDLSSWSMNSISPTGISTMFCDCKKLTEIKGIENWSFEITTFYIMFSGCESIKRIDFGNLKGDNVKGGYGGFYHCYNLEYLNLGGVVLNPNSGDGDEYGNFLNSDSKLVDFYIKGIGAGKEDSRSFSFSACTSLSNESLQRIIDSLVTLENNTTKTLVLGSKILSRLTDEQILTATNKGWSLI